MERTHAFKVLRLDQSADGRMVEHAYWTLVRQAQRRAEKEPDATREIDELNEAYGVLAPEKRAAAPAIGASARSAQGAGSFMDGLADFLAEEALRTRARWHRRNPEVAIIGGGALLLMVLGLAAGASFWGVLVATLLVFGAIWAPWRRPHRPDQER